MGTKSDFIITLLNEVESLLSFRLGPASFRFKLDVKGINDTIDDRIAKINIAKTNLNDAITAINELEQDTLKSKKELEKTLKNVELAKEKKTALQSEVNNLTQLAGAEVQTMRTVIGIPSKGALWAQRFIGFILGIVASLIASYIYNYISTTFGTGG